jgi:hypothetical protein
MHIKERGPRGFRMNQPATHGVAESVGDGDGDDDRHAEVEVLIKQRGAFGGQRSTPEADPCQGLEPTLTKQASTLAPADTLKIYLCI